MNVKIKGKIRERNVKIKGKIRKNKGKKKARKIFFRKQKIK